MNLKKTIGSISALGLAGLALYKKLPPALITVVFRQLNNTVFIGLRSRAMIAGENDH
jgi:hypothetical protein